MTGDTTVKRERWAKKNKYGDKPSAPESVLEISGCLIAPRTEVVSRGEGEITDRGRDGIVVGLTLFAPAGSDITYTDTILIPGKGRWSIEGEPADWTSPTGWAPGMSVALRRAVG